MTRYIGAALAFVFFIATAGTASAQVYVDGYTKNNGTYVQPHYRSSPNNTTLDNYSTRGNVNPYTGAIGTRDPYSAGSSSNFGGGMYGSGSSYNSLGGGLCAEGGVRWAFLAVALWGYALGAIGGFAMGVHYQHAQGARP